jgi:hypothetical protein
MQVIPKAAAAAPIDIPNVEFAEPNIHAGTKMLRTIEDAYFRDPKLDSLNKTLLTFASYNAGPTRIEPGLPQQLAPRVEVEDEARLLVVCAGEHVRASGRLLALSQHPQSLRRQLDGELFPVFRLRSGEMPGLLRQICLRWPVASASKTKSARSRFSDASHAASSLVSSLGDRKRFLCTSYK